MAIARCRSCDAKIVWLKTKKGKNMPVDWDEDAQVDAEAGRIFDRKGHTSHFDTCPDAEPWRSKP